MLDEGLKLGKQRFYAPHVSLCMILHVEYGSIFTCSFYVICLERTWFFIILMQGNVDLNEAGNTAALVLDFLNIQEEINLV